MPATYEKIATTTLGSANATVSFTSIGSGYTDLRLVLVGTVTTGGGFGHLRFNSDSATNYSFTNVYGDGTSAASSRQTSVNSIKILDNITGGGTSSTIPFLTEIDIFSYAGSTNKTAMQRFSGDKNGSGITISLVGLWRSTSAITEVSITSSDSTFKIGTTATLYGILKA